MQRPNTLDPNGENLIQVVSCLDETVDWTVINQKEYGKSRDWNVLQPGLNNGAAPTIFYIRLVPIRARGLIADRAVGENVRALDWFQMAVARIDNLKRTDGATIASWLPETKQALSANGRPVAVISDAELEFLSEQLGSETIKEIGEVADKYNFFHPKKCTDYPLPHSLDRDTMSIR